MWSRSAPLALVAVLATPSAAAGIEYPPPSHPGELPPPPPAGDGATLHVCKKPRCFQSIQMAVDAAGSGDRIKVANGTYREGVQIRGAKRRGLRITGNLRRPGRVKLRGDALRGARGRAAFAVRRVDHVTIEGFKAVGYRRAGFTVRGATGYTLTRLVAKRTGAHGLLAWRSRGGTISHSAAYGASGAAFRVAATPPQVRPRRTFIRQVRGHRSGAGFTGTGMRYATLHDSGFRSNGAGIVADTDGSAAHAPSAQNVIKDNEVSSNGFGIVMLGGHDNVVEGNAIHGNRLAGLAMIDRLGPTHESVRTLDRTVVRGNSFGAAAGSPNAHDIAYDGSGSDNCFADNGPTQNNLPADDSELVPCPFEGPNGVNDDARREMLALAAAG